MDKKENYVIVKSYKRKLATRKHKKRALRVVLFFILLVIFGFVEDMIVMYVTRAASVFSIFFRIENILIVLLIAIVFTLIAEFTEKLYAGKKPKEIVNGTAKFIKKEEKIIGDKLKSKK